MRYGWWKKCLVNWCGKGGGGYVSYIPMSKIASKMLLGKIFCLSLSSFSDQASCGCENIL